MSETIPILKREPLILAAGDTVSWERGIADYPANLWTLTYVLRGPKVITFAATNAAGNFLVTLTSATTAAWKPGLYRVGAYVTSSASQQVQVSTAFPRMTILPNLASKPNGADAESFAAKALAVVEETILKLTSKTYESANIEGTMYTLANIRDLWLMRERYASEVRRERQKELLDAGLGGSNKVAIRFRSLQQGTWPINQRPPWQ